ncbi:MAG: hypothetical protein M0P97_02670 [Candidatus Moranbacteria bacterium]|jgi:hypothetical protein|nr:hypothetical protein [Candidatus Moranbacteria bacterium]
MKNLILVLAMVMAGVSSVYLSNYLSNTMDDADNTAVAVFMTIPDGDIVIENMEKYLNLHPEDEIILPIAGEMVPAKFINFFFRTSDKDGAEVLKGIPGDFSPGEKEEINKRQSHKLLAKF